MTGRARDRILGRSTSRRVRALVLALAPVLLAACGARVDDAASFEVDTAVLEVFTPYRDADADAFRDVLGAFSERTGIETRHVGSAEFSQRLRERIRDGDPPAVALVPQVSVVEEMARQGRLVVFDDDDLFGGNDAAARFVRGADDIGVVDGERVGVWFRLAVKSLVWYPPRAFRDGGYTIPATWSETLALSARMQTDGLTPWCMGMEAFGATGWVGSDWVEDLVLRLHGQDVYDAWAAGEVPFTDERIREAFDAFGDVALAEGRVLGGRRAILSTPALEAIDPMLDDPPSCLLSRQASFQESALPAGTQIGPEGDVDVFPLPQAGEGADAAETQGPPLIAAGDVAVAFDEGDPTRALMAYLADPAAGEIWARQGGFTSPHATFDASSYATAFDRRIATMVTDAAVVRFDASDQMPPAVGTGTFWDGIVDYVAGVPLTIVLEQIQAGYETGT